MSGPRSRVVVFALAVVVAAGAAGCKKKAGSSCTGSEATCVDPRTAITCRGKTFVEVACAGAMGCAKYRDRAACDTSIASPGMECMGEDDEYACSSDKRRASLCKGSRFEPYLECRGKDGCAMLGRRVSCDQSIAAPGDVCKTEGVVACGDDAKRMVVCKNGRFELHRYCRGQYGCALTGETPSCDETLSLVDDPCGMPGQVVCAVDGMNELVCESGRFRRSLTCRTGCMVSSRPGRPIDCK